MILVKKRKDVIEISGHAAYSNYGSDIVCASVSSIVYTTINGIMNIDSSAIDFIDEKNIIIKVKKHTEVIDILIRNMIDLLLDLEKQYPKNIKIDKGE